MQRRWRNLNFDIIWINVLLFMKLPVLCLNVTGLTSILCIVFLSYCVQWARAFQNWPNLIFPFYNGGGGRCQWPRCLRRRSAAARLLRSWVRIPPWTWMFVYYECCVLSGRGLCDELLTRPEDSYPTVVRRCVWSRNLKNEEAMTRVGSQRHRKKNCGGERS